MTESAWRYLEAAWGDDVYPDGDLGALVASLWPDPRQAVRDLVTGWGEVLAAEKDEAARRALDAASRGYRVGALSCELSEMRDVLGAGLRAVGPPAVGHLHARLAGSKDLDERADAVLLLAGFGAGAAGSVPLLAAEVADPADPRARHVLRCAAAYALGEIGVASPAAVEALARVAGDRAEPQSLRTYSAEALMDLGPAAAAAVPVLERLLRDESEDDDLRHFAWSALKSVGAASREHPCGGTVAGHMRSLYRAGGPSEADGPGSGG